MKNPEVESVILDQLIEWGRDQPLVRAMILTSTRAVPNAALDRFSDYDVILALSDVQPFFAERDWLAAFGQVLVMYRDPLERKYGYLKSGNVVQFESGLKIDFTLWPVEILAQLVAEPALPPEFDAGYRVLLDKDNLTAGLQPPSYRAYIPQPPTAEQYREAIEVCLLEAIYVAKLLWRDDLMAAKEILDHMMKQEHLLPLLEWHGEIAHGWSVKPGPYGRRLKQWLRPDLWAMLESTYAGASLEENWTALFNSIALLRKVAVEVGAALGYVYPHEMEQRTLVYLQQVRSSACREYDNRTTREH